MSPISIPAAFDPAQTFSCGQAFRWVAPQAIDDTPTPAAAQADPLQEPCDTHNTASPDAHQVFEGAAGSHYLRMEKQGDTLLFHCSEEEFETFWRAYFDLDADYPAMRAALSAVSPVLKEAAAYAPGICLLRQDPWEALCSFIISQNNNIPRITGIISRLCETFGAPIPDAPLKAFPTPETLAALTVEDLSPLRAGFRAKYLIDAARKVAAGHVNLKKTAALPADFGRAELQKINGVGPKVAECALLFGFHKTDCFPMDVWMKRAMATLLPGLTPADFGANAGLAQQYIFHYSRMHPELFAGGPCPGGANRA